MSADALTYRWEVGEFLCGLVLRGDGVGAGASENDQIQQGIRSETIGTVNTGASGFAGCVQAFDDHVLAVLHLDDLTLVVGRHTAHVVMHGGKDRDGLFGHVDTREDLGSLADTGQTFVQELGVQVAQLQEDMIVLFANTTRN